MKLWSDSWANGERIPARYAAGKLDAGGRRHLLRQPQPAPGLERRAGGHASLVLICHDFDVPSRGDDVNQADREVPADLPRVDFFHWVLVDLPPALGAHRRGRVQPRLHGARQARARRRCTARARA